MMDIVDELNDLTGYMHETDLHGIGVCNKAIEEIIKLRQQLAKPAEWISVKEKKPKKDINIYFVSGGEVFHGSYSKTTDYEKPNKRNKSSWTTLTTFAAFNHGYDGDSGPIYNVTHWMYENMPAPPAAYDALQD
jgi:hypothetical protein